jgi:hypothetical protein
MEELQAQLEKELQVWMLEPKSEMEVVLVSTVVSPWAQFAAG